MNNAHDLLKGAIDLHVHAAPSTINRPLDDYEVAERARRAGMRGLVLKDANSITSYRAFLVRKIGPQIELFGGVCLNYSQGGLNIHAIDSAFRLISSQPLTKIVWMPTLDAKNDRIIKQTNVNGISILENNDLSEEAIEVLKKIREYDLVLGTGHLSLNEIKILVSKASKMGIKKILVNHVDSFLFKMTIEDQKELREMGAILEHTVAVCMPSYLPKPRSATEIAQAIKDVGASGCVMATDFVDMYQPDPAEGMRIFIHLMMKCGISREEIEKMVKENPAVLLGLAPPTDMDASSRQI